MSSLTSSTSSATTTSPDSTSTANANNTLASATLRSPTLYVFVAFTALLLLFAARSCITHRRRRFRIAAEGDSGGMGQVLRRDSQEKPKIWEVWVDEPEQANDSSYSGSPNTDGLGKGDGRWEEILPVSVIIMSSDTSKPVSLEGDGSTTSPPISEPEPRHAHRSIRTRLLGRRPFATTSLAQPQVASRERNEPAMEQNSEMVHLAGDARGRPQEDKRLQVTVLISMPTENGRRPYGCDTRSSISAKGQGKGPAVDDNDGDAEPDIPDVVFGVSEANLRP